MTRDEAVSTLQTALLAVQAYRALPQEEQNDPWNMITLTAEMGEAMFLLILDAVGTTAELA